MKLWTKFLILALVLISFLTLFLKFYFMPKANESLETSIKDQMVLDMQAFENVILIVATVAGQNEDVVRKAFFSISENKNIPIELRRSTSIENQYGRVEGHGPQNQEELDAFESGSAMFRENEEYFEYIYPLKARNICQNCHKQPNGAKIEIGYVLGLAIKKVPKSILKESTLSYQIMDLYWENLFMSIVVFSILVIAMYYWFIVPLAKLSKKVHPVLLKGEDDKKIPDNEIEMIGEGLDILLKDQSDSDS